MQLISCNNPKFDELWLELVNSVRSLNSFYQPVNLLFYAELFSSVKTSEISFLVLCNGLPYCGIKAYLHTQSDNSRQVSCFGLPLLYLERITEDHISLEASRRFVKSHFRTILEEFTDNFHVYYKDELVNNSLSPISRLLLEKGANTSPDFSQYIDLRQPEAFLHSQLTKSYKWSVNWAKKNLHIQILDSNNINSDYIEQFRLLHHQEAGRQTRSLKSWLIQHRMVLRNEAFCVFAFMDNSLVSAALFPCSSTHCFYGVSASVRRLFDKPLGHGVVWHAIMYSKEKGIHHFELGNQVFSALAGNVTDKDLGISYFKRSFGGNTRVALNMHLSL